MQEKEQKILEEIIRFYQQEKAMPPIRYLQQKFSYHSTNSIAYYLNKLEEKGYLKRNIKRKLVINDILLVYPKIKIIPIINDEKSFLYEILDTNKNYIGFKLTNNYFVQDNLLKNDLLIIEKTLKIHNNEIGLFLINHEYRLMKYQEKDNFYLLKDKEEIYLHKINLIGKVIMLKRQIKRLG